MANKPSSYLTNTLSFKVQLLFHQKFQKCKNVTGSKRAKVDKKTHDQFWEFLLDGGFILFSNRIVRRSFSFLIYVFLDLYKWTDRRIQSVICRRDGHHDIKSKFTKNFFFKLVITQLKVILWKPPGWYF